MEKTLKNKQQVFLKKLKGEAKVISALKKEQLIPDQFSTLANFVASHSWQILSLLALFISLIWELFFYQGSNNG